MENCLHTKYKSVVNNDNLDYIDSIRLHTEGDATRTFKVRYNQNSQLQIKGEGNFLNGSGTSIGKTLDITANVETTVRLSTGSYDVVFRNAKNITTLYGENYSGTGYIFKITDASNLPIKCTSLTNVRFKNMLCSGNFTELLYSDTCVSISTNGILANSRFVVTINNAVPKKYVVNLTSESVSEDITGDINNFSKWYADSNQFYWRDSKISGELSTLFDAIAAEGLVNSIQILPNTITTLNGVATTATAKTVTFSNGSWTIS